MSWKNFDFRDVKVKLITAKVASLQPAMWNKVPVSNTTSSIAHPKTINLIQFNNPFMMLSLIISLVF